MMMLIANAMAMLLVVVMVMDADFYFRDDDIELIPTIVMSDFFDNDDEAIVCLRHLDANHIFDAYAHNACVYIRMFTLMISCLYRACNHNCEYK